MTVETIARDRTELVTVSPDDAIRTVAETMRDETVGSVVVERDDEAVGIITDRDLTVEILAEGTDPPTLTAREVMTPDPVTADVGKGVFELCELMREESVRRMPVVDDGRLVGIVTLDDLVILLGDEMHELSEVVRSESPPFQSP
jgi:signal-transduction protein with cAMP-binding, CBS, and nucleotidyltransferase domain